VAARQRPLPADNSAAVLSHAAALRDEMYTFAPCAMKPTAIIRPMPREPPVMRPLITACHRDPAAKLASWTIM